MAARLLVVDPDISFMVGLKQALESTGEFRVSLAANAPAAEDALRHIAYDIAAVSFGIGSLDAMELNRRLRSVQPDLRLIVCPATPAELERTRFMDVQAVVAKPFTASQVLPHLRRVLQAKLPVAAPQDDFSPPQMPPSLRGLTDLQRHESFDPPRIPTGLLARFGLRREEVEAPHDSGAEAGSAEPARAERRRPQTAELRWPETPPRDLDRATEPPAAAPAYAEPPATHVLEPHAPQAWASAADAEGDQALGWLEWSAGDSTAPEPWSLADESDVVEAEQPGADAAFDEILDAFADLPPDAARSPRNQAFDDLVDSMRGAPSQPARRTRLEDLLESIAAEAEPDEGAPDGANTLDRVLNAMRQGPAPTASAADDAALEDTTIGEVIDGLFEPSFQGVLDALAGEDIADEEPDEPAPPTLDLADELTPQADDLVTWDELGTAELPDWLAAYDAGETPPAQYEAPAPVDDGDSTHYPAMAALSAVSAAEEDEFSLNQLLNQLETQLAAKPAHRPQLKPLPSWEQADELRGADELAALFDRTGLDDESLLEPPSFEWDQPAPAAEDARRTGGRTPTEDEAWLRDDWMAQPTEADDGVTRPAAASGEWADDDEIQRAFYEGVRRDQQADNAFWEPAEEWEEPSGQARFAEPVEEASDWPGDADLLRDTADTDEWVEPPAAPAWEGEALDPLPPAAQGIFETADEQPAYEEWSQEPAPDDRSGYDAAAPAESPREAAPGDTLSAEAADEADLVQIAVLLTQYALESSAQATLLTRPGTLVAQAGDLPIAAMDRLFDLVDAAWRLSTADATSLIRFIALPETGDFLLYSTRVERDLTLSMAFHANTPVRTIRRQAQRLSASLELVPDTDEVPGPTAERRPPAAEPPAAQPAVPQQAPATVIQADAAPAEPPEDQGPHAAYTCVWLPADQGLEIGESLAEDLRAWIGEAAEAAAWDVLDVTVRPDYVQVALSVPQKIPPDDAIGHLMQRTAEQVAAHYPQLASGGPLWIDGYYVVAPPRDLSEREIGRFMTYQRQAQIEA